MSTIQDFENAPVGATATSPNGNIALKTERCALEWSLYDSHGFDAPTILRSDEMVGFTLNPAAPTTAQEALDLAWDLAYPVKEGQTIPEGVRLLDRLDRNDLSVYTTRVDFTVTARESLNIRTLDPLPDPEPTPDWLDAPAVLAATIFEDRAVVRSVFVRENKDGTRWVCDTRFYRWDELTDVTPLYPKETDK